MLQDRGSAALVDKWPGLFSIAVMNTMIKSHPGGGKGLLQLTVFSPLWRETSTGAQGRSLEVRTEAKGLEECCLPACSHGLSRLFSPKVQDHLPRGDTTQSGLDFST